MKGWFKIVKNNMTKERVATVGGHLVEMLRGCITLDIICRWEKQSTERIIRIDENGPTDSYLYSVQPFHFGVVCTDLYKYDEIENIV